MEAIKNVLVCLEFAEHDEQLIRFAKLLEEGLQLDRIVFLFVNRTTDIPEAIKTRYLEHTDLDEVEKQVEKTGKRDIKREGHG